MTLRDTATRRYRAQARLQPRGFVVAMFRQG
jgi:hypothetical protein